MAVSATVVGTTDFVQLDPIGGECNSRLHYDGAVEVAKDQGPLEAQIVTSGRTQDLPSTCWVLVDSRPTPSKHPGLWMRRTTI